LCCSHVGLLFDPERNWATSMKAVYITKFGGPECLELREVPDAPAPQVTDVLIRVKAAGLNRADLLQRRGLYPPPAGYSANIPGLEFAGEVVSTGSNVKDFKAGDRVFGITAGEAQAEFLLTEESLLAHIPASLSFREAGAVPEAFITAHDAIFTIANLKGSETLLIHAVGSGVGLAALQLAKARGARVFGTSRTSGKLVRCKEFGLDETVLAGDEANFAEIVSEKTGGRGVDVVLDLVGAAYFPQNLICLASRGRLVLVGLTSGPVAEFDLRAALHKRLSIVGTVLRGRSTDEKADATMAFVRDVLPLFESGKIRANVDRVFAAADVRLAHEYLESNDSFGKVILEF
jgi:NADPH:quinone reductase